MYKINNELKDRIVAALRHKSGDYKIDMENELLIMQLRRCKEKLFCANCGFEKFDKKDICSKCGH